MRLAAIVLFLLACEGPTDPDAGATIDAPLGGADAPGLDAPRTDAGPPPVFVYVHSRDTLYRLDPRTNALAVIGAFGCVSVSTDAFDSGDGMTDLAVSRDGILFGVGRTAPASDAHWLLSVDAMTGACTPIAEVRLAGATTRVQGLTFLPAGAAGEAETLAGVGTNGELFRIDPLTAVATLLATVPAGSDTRGGDVVSIEGLGTFLISSGSDLVRFDPASGTVLETTPLTGDFASDAVGMGLGFWGGRFYAATFMGRLLVVDVDAGTLTDLPLTGTVPPDVSFRGAAVTTSAPLEPLF